MKARNASTRFGLLMIGLGGLLGMALGVGAAVFTESQVSPPVSIPINVGYTSVGLTVPVVEVGVRGGPRLHLLLDTGSSGVEIYRASLDSTAGFGPVGVADMSQTFTDGAVLDGYADSVELDFGSRPLLTGPMTVEMVTSISCSPELPCLEGQMALGHGAYQVNGVLGIGPDPDTGEFVNPIRMLPDPYNRIWTVAIGPAGVGGTLTLGSDPPTNPKAVIDLPSVNRPHFPEGFRDSFQACWRIGDDRPWYTRTMLDTGTSATVLLRKAVDFQTVPGGSRPKRASPAQDVTVRLPKGRTIIQTTTNGVEEGGTYVLVWPSQSEFAIAGINDLANLTLIYDVSDSQLLVA